MSDQIPPPGPPVETVDPDNVAEEPEAPNWETHMEQLREQGLHPDQGGTPTEEGGDTAAQKKAKGGNKHDDLT